jgi:hypothetical protein
MLRPDQRQRVLAIYQKYVDEAGLVSPYGCFEAALDIVSVDSDLSRMLRLDAVTRRDAVALDDLMQMVDGFEPRRPASD